MKPILDKKGSKIVNFGPSGLDLPLPSSAQGDLKRIRFDGQNFVDLEGLSNIYVTHENEVFELHARSDIPNSHLIPMTYGDRRKLVRVGPASIRLKTDKEITAEVRVNLIHAIKSKAKLAMNRQMGMIIEQFMFDQKLMYVLIWSLRTQNAQGLQFVDAYLDEMGGIFDIADPNFKADLIADYKKIKAVIKDYNDDMGGI